jgi:hypothetical protein
LLYRQSFRPSAGGKPGVASARRFRPAQYLANPRHRLTPGLNPRRWFVRRSNAKAKRQTLSAIRPRDDRAVDPPAARFNPGWNRPPFEPPTAGSLRRNGAKPKSVRIGGTPPSHPRQCAGCPQGANHPATAAIRSSGSGPDPHRLRSFLRRRSTGQNATFGQDSSFSARSNLCGRRHPGRSSRRPRAGGQYFRARA